MNQVGWPSGLGINAKASPRPPERRISQPVAGGRRTAAAMLRPWLVQSWDGRLATTRRPFSFYSRLSSDYLSPMLHLLLLSRGSPAADATRWWRRCGAPGTRSLPRAMVRRPRRRSAPRGSTRCARSRMARARAGAGSARRWRRRNQSEPDSLDAAERRHIALTLRYTGGNRRRAAQLLGISRSTLLHKVRKYDLDQVDRLIPTDLRARPHSRFGCTAFSGPGRAWAAAREVAFGCARAARPRPFGWRCPMRAEGGVAEAGRDAERGKERGRGGCR